jgi:hypothetical protein
MEITTIGLLYSAVSSQALWGFLISWPQLSGRVLLLSGIGLTGLSTMGSEE